MIDSIDILGSEVPVFKSNNIDRIFDNNIIAFIIEKLSSDEVQEKIGNVMYGGSKVIELDDGISMSFINGGMFSLVYEMNIDGKAYIIKVRNPEMQSLVNYMSEMNRMNQLDKELSGFLDQYNISVPNYQFATVNMCCRQMVEGEQLTPREAQSIVPLIEEEMNNFVERKKLKNADLWGNTMVDLRDKTGNISGNNFIKQADGKIYFIDPFNN